MVQDKITKSQFITSIRNKYPQYKNIDDDVLYDKIISKYPSYEERIMKEEPVELKKKKIKILL